MGLTEAKAYIRSRVSISENGCWNWNLHVDKDGYGLIGNPNKLGSKRAHRASYIAFNGEIPAGMVVMHLCDNPACCNPKHLVAGTQKENIEDSRNKGRGGAYWYPGEENPKSILNADSVRRIRALRASGRKYSEIALDVGCCKALAVLVATGKRWAHII